MQKSQAVLAYDEFAGGKGILSARSLQTLRGLLLSSLFLSEPGLHEPPSLPGRRVARKCRLQRARRCIPRPRTATAGGGARAPPPPHPLRPGPRRPPRSPNFTAPAPLPAPASSKRRGRRFPSPDSHGPSLTCPARVCRERKTSRSTSWERLGLQLGSRLLSPTPGRLCSAAAAMTPRRPPEPQKSAHHPTPPPLFGFRRPAMTQKHSVLGSAGL